MVHYPKYSIIHYNKYSIFYFDLTLFQKYALTKFGRFEFSIRYFFFNSRNPKHTQRPLYTCFIIAFKIIGNPKICTYVFSMYWYSVMCCSHLRGLS
jgi:hypothetical protein